MELCENGTLRKFLSSEEVGGLYFIFKRYYTEDGEIYLNHDLQEIAELDNPPFERTLNEQLYPLREIFTGHAELLRSVIEELK